MGMDTEENEIPNLDVEDLASLARRYYTTRFPNPQRLGCPTPGEIIKVVSGRQVPDQALREHLFECSECFGEYRQALAQCRLAPDDVALRKRLISIFTLRPSAMAVTVLILLSLFFIDRLFWPKPAPEAGNELVARSIPSDVRAGVVGESAPNQTVAIANPPVEQRAMGGAWKSSSILKPGELDGLSVETIDVDLDNYLVLRRSPRESATAVSEEPSDREVAKTLGHESSPREKTISLPATHANLVLRLPETGIPGKYNVSLINAFGRPLLSNSAFSPDGDKLQVMLDLRRVPPKKYRLHLWRNGEAPAFYDVLIGAR